MLVARFQLPMPKNYNFIKKKDYLRTGVVGCLTPSPRITRLPNLGIKIFYPSALDQEKRPFSQPRIGNKIKQSQVTNHTLEKPNDWWRLHLPLVNPLKSIHFLVTHLRYNPPSQHSSLQYPASVAAVGGQTAVRHQQHPQCLILNLNKGFFNIYLQTLHLVLFSLSPLLVMSGKMSMLYLGITWQNQQTF